MDNIEDSEDAMGKYILDTAQSTILISNIALAKLLNEGFQAYYETCGEESIKEISIAGRPNGCGVVAVCIENINKIYFMDVFLNEDTSIERKTTIIDLPSEFDVKNMWENLLDEMYAWSQNKIKNIEIKY